MKLRKTAAVSRFAERVYEAVSRIPAGRVATYGGVARAVGCACARAVGQALRRNPFAPGVPCHRVIASDWRIGGFQGADGGAAVRRKAALLAGEGVRFVDGRLEDPSQVIEIG